FKLDVGVHAYVFDVRYETILYRSGRRGLPMCRCGGFDIRISEVRLRTANFGRRVALEMVRQMSRFVVKLLVVLALLPAPSVLSAQPAENAPSVQPSVPSASSMTTVLPQPVETASEGSAESSGKPP